MKKLLSVLMSTVMLFLACGAMVFAEDKWSESISANSFVNEILCNEDIENGFVYFYDGQDPEYNVEFPADGLYSLNIQYRMNGESDPDSKEITIKTGAYTGTGNIRKTTNEEGFYLLEDVLTFEADKGIQSVFISGVNGVSVVKFDIVLKEEISRFSVNAWEVSEGNNAYYIETSAGSEYISMYSGGVASYSVTVPVSGFYSLSANVRNTDPANNPEGSFKLSSADVSAVGNVTSQDTYAVEKGILEIFLEKGEQTIVLSEGGGVSFKEMVFTLKTAGISVAAVSYDADNSYGSITNNGTYINCKNGAYIAYTITAEKAGDYELYVNNASYFTGYKIHVFIDNTAYETAAIDGIGWGNYQKTLLATVKLKEGTHTLALQATNECDIDAVFFKETENASYNNLKLEAELYSEATGVYKYETPDENGNTYTNLWSHGGGLSMFNMAEIKYEIELPVYGRYSVDVVYGSTGDYPVKMSANGTVLNERVLSATGGNTTLVKEAFGEFAGKNVTIALNSLVDNSTENPPELFIDYITLTLEEDLGETDVVAPVFPYTVTDVKLICGYGSATVGELLDNGICHNAEIIKVYDTNGIEAAKDCCLAKGMKITAVSMLGNVSVEYTVGDSMYTLLEPEFDISGLGTDGIFTDDAQATANVSILNYLPQDKEIAIYIVQYSGNKLVKTTVDSANLREIGTISLSASIEIENVENTKLKAFVWDNATHEPLKAVSYIDTSLAGKKILFLGDSITGNYMTGYPETVAAMTGAECVNAGFGETTYVEGADINEVSGVLSAVHIADGLTDSDYDWAAAEAYAASSENAMIAPHLENLKNADLSEFDYLTIWLGTNDYACGNVIDNSENAYDTATVSGSVRYTVSRINEKYPNLKIIVFLPMYRSLENNYKGQTITEYNAAIKNASLAFKNVTVVDMYKESGIDRYNQSSYLYDGLHPRYDIPMNMIAGKIINGILSVE